MGVPISDTYLFNLNFADDQVIIAQDAYDLEFMLKRLYKEYERWGMTVSLKKTECLVINTDAKFEGLISDNTSINQVDEFKYLGVLIDRNALTKRNRTSDPGRN